MREPIGFSVTMPGQASPTLGQPAAVVRVDLSIYSQPAVERACYKLTDRCWIEIRRDPDSMESLELALHPKAEEFAIRPLVGELFNELLDQQIRERLAVEAGPLRELIVAQAFAEGNLLDPWRDEGDVAEDPLGISTRERV